MARAKVYNDNKVVWKEEFRGEMLEIPAGGSIEMEYFDAYQFRGQFKAPRKDYDGGFLPESQKMIRVEPLDAPSPELEQHTCVVCKFKAGGEKVLKAHVEEAHAHLAVTDDEAEKEIKYKQGKKAAS